MRFLLKILTLGLLGRDTRMGYERSVWVSWSPSDYSRGSVEETERIVQKYFPKSEVSMILNRLGHTTKFMFTDETTAEKFFKDLEKIGWDTSYWRVRSVNDRRLYFAKENEYVSLDRDDFAVNFRDLSLHPTFDLYHDGKSYRTNWNDEPVKLLNELKPKEVQNLGKKQDAA